MRHPLALSLSLSCIGLAVAALAACGGGGGTDSAPSATPSSVVTVSTYITDNLATEYSQVWVGVLKLVIVNAASGEPTTLFDSATPVVYNLSSLASVGQLMSSVKIPAGVYGRVMVTLASGVKLVSLDGTTTINAKLSADGSPLTVPVKLDFDTGAAAPIVIDFNLAKFSYDAVTGLVSPTLEKKDPTQPFMRQQAEVRGVLVSVGSDGFVMNDKRLGDGLQVKLATDGVIFDEASHQVLALGGLAAGSTIEARGQVSLPAKAGDPTTLTAAVVRVVDLSHDALPTALKFTGGEGKVTLIAGSLVTVALSEARFAPGAQGNSVTVDTSKAVYTHGAAGDLAIGTEIGFRGLLDTAGVLQALFVDVEGAPSKNDRDSHPNLRFADLQATVISLVGNTLSVTANPGEGNRNSTATTYTVDISKAEMKAWGTACLVAGQKIRVKGALAGTQMVALVVETPADCMKPTPTPPAPPASSPAPTIAVSGSR